MNRVLPDRDVAALQYREFPVGGRGGPDPRSDGRVQERQPRETSSGGQGLERPPRPGLEHRGDRRPLRAQGAPRHQYRRPPRGGHRHCGIGLLSPHRRHPQTLPERARPGRTHICRVRPGSVLHGAHRRSGLAASRRIRGDPHLRFRRWRVLRGDLRLRPNVDGGGERRDLSGAFCVAQERVVQESASDAVDDPPQEG